MRIALAQVNPIVGDIAGNTARIAESIDRAAVAGAELVVFGEMSVLGYPPRDLLGKQRLGSESVAAVESLAGRCRGLAALVGYVRPVTGVSGRSMENAAALLQDGSIRHVHAKTLLPTYDVFDETRYFQPGGPPQCFEIGGVTVGVSICEDLWDPTALGGDMYGADPIAPLIAQGAEIIVNMAASPFQMGKAEVRESLLTRQAARSAAAIAFVNQVGGNDELIFDGGSCVVSPAGEVLGRAKSFAEDLLIVDTAGPVGRVEPSGDRMGRLGDAIRLGLRDYVRKCGFSSVVLGLSGGIDSAVVAALAADAVGPENVLALAMPSRFSSDHSLADARRLAGTLGVNFRVVEIEPMHAAFEKSLAELLSGGNTEIAGENIQARIRGNVVMAASNALGHLALATGNKSELAVGYCTLYGDMVGGLAPLGDVFKTDVFRLAERLNAEAGCERIDGAIIRKAPSAELKPGQFDRDSLPPYDLLDEILRRYVEADLTVDQIAAAGFDANTVRGVVDMVDRAEYKRTQAAPVLKVTARAFGTGRRMPIAQHYGREFRR